MRTYRVCLFCLVSWLPIVSAATADTPSAREAPARSEQPSTAASIVTGTKPSLFDPEFVRAVIEHGYSRASQFTDQSGSSVRFELDDFTTIRDADFDTVYVRDMATPPGGQTIQIARHRTTNQHGDVLRLSYEASWIDKPHQSTKPKVAEELNYRLSDAVEMNSEHYGGKVLGLTSFRVTASLKGRHRSYRAAMIWIATKPEQQSLEDEDFSFQLVDHVSVGVSQAFFSPSPVQSQVDPRTQAPFEANGG